MISSLCAILDFTCYENIVLYFVCWHRTQGTRQYLQFELFAQLNSYAERYQFE